MGHLLRPLNWTNNGWVFFGQKSSFPTQNMFLNFHGETTKVERIKHDLQIQGSLESGHWEGWRICWFWKTGGTFNPKKRVPREKPTQTGGSSETWSKLVKYQANPPMLVFFFYQNPTVKIDVSILRTWYIPSPNTLGLEVLRPPKTYRSNTKPQEVWLED